MILRQGVRPYVATLPYFDKITEFQQTKPSADAEIEFPKHSTKNEYKLDLEDWRKTAMSKMQQESSNADASDWKNLNDPSDDYRASSRFESKLMKMFASVYDE